MKKITLLSMLFVFSICFNSYAQSTINITTTGGSFPEEKWVNITTAIDGGGSQVWGQGDGTYGNAPGLLNVDIPIAPGTYYVNCYDKYADSWDGTLISITAYGATLNNNGGVEPDDGTDDDASSSFGDTQAQELEASLMIVVPNPPACSGPNSLLATSTSLTEVTLSWAAGGSETNWTYEYGAMGYTQGSGSSTATTSMSASLTGLTASNQYDFYVQANCGGGNGDSTWSGPFTWTQPNVGDSCSVPLIATVNADCAAGGASTTVIDFSTAADLGPTGTCDTTTGNQGAWIQFTTPASGAIKLTNDGVDNEIVIYDSCGGAEIFCAALGAELSLSGFAPNTVYMMAIWKDSFQTLTTDTFCLEAITCTFPTGLTLDNVFETTAQISWTAGGTETEWEYVVQASGTGVPVTAGTSTMNNPLSLTSLTNGTDYEFYLRAVCGPGDFSDWSGPLNFTTPLAAIVPNYTNDFSTFPGAGWSEAAGAYGSPSGTSSSWVTDDFGNDTGHVNGQSAKMNIYTTTHDEYLISPTFNLSGSTYYLNFDLAFTEWGNTNPGVWDTDDYVALLVTQDGGTTWSELTRWDSGSTIGTSREAATEITLTGYNATTKFAFFAFSDTDNGPDNDFFIDNFDISSTSTLSVEDNIIEGFSIYPNPVNNMLSFRALDNIETISIYNLLGQEVMRAEPRQLQAQINMTDLPTGMYVIKVLVGEQLGSYRVVKQ
ncbi:MAG: T9SS type A sorting domain-containing protein [Flavobacteriaceae bacterium]